MRVLKFLVFVFFLTIFSLLSVGAIRAACTEKDNPEFHSLRPYPAKPCSVEVADTASFCSDSLTVSFKISEDQDEDHCIQNAGGTHTCTYSVSYAGISVTIGLSEAEFPIMGNTEDVINSQNPIDSQNSDNNISPEQRVNDYVSWYLNGIFNRAEYSPITIYAPSIVDFSGPLNKLLPQEIAQQTRRKTVENAGITRHDQVVGCTYSLNFPGFQLFSFPGPCYIDAGILDPIKDFLARKEWRLSDWQKHIPPVRSEFKSYAEYYVKYQGWRGERCLTVTIPESLPVIGKIPIFGGLTVMLCGDDPTRPNFWANLYPYIPLSSTEDRKGELEVTAQSVQAVSPDLTISKAVFTGDNTADLYFAHMEEATGLASGLKKTYVPKDMDGSVNNPSNVGQNPECTAVDVRSGPGDDLYASKDEITGTFSFDAKFSCDFEADETGPCQKTIAASLRTTTNVPLADKAWTDLVAGSGSIFKRIYPKIGKNAPVQCLADIPAGASINFSGSLTGTSDLYFPHIGGVSEYFLKGIQTALRPKGYGEAVVSGTNCPDDGNLNGSCGSTMTAINIAIANAAGKYNVPTALLKAIFEIEGTEFIADPENYNCQENTAGAAGIMQITKSSYNVVTCENERIVNDIGICNSASGKLSRCDIDDAFELAARILLWKAGKWVYGPGNCSATGGISATDKNTIYNASCKYYGSFSPDVATLAASGGIPVDKRRSDGDMNYCDIVCYKMGLCPPYPTQAEQ